MKAYWNCEAEELKKNFQVSEEGLLPAQVEAIRREKGENVLQEGKRKSVAAVFAQQRPARCDPDHRRSHFHVFRKCREHGCNPSCACDECGAWNRPAR